jgi:hypothetical protein
VSAPTCAEVADIAAAVVTLAQSDTRPPDVVVAPAPAASPSSAPRPPAPAPAPSPSPDLDYSFTLGYGAFTEGPATPVVFGSGERTTFNPAQGLRLGFGVTHALGWWKHSLHVSAAYYRQSTTTGPVPVYPAVSSMGSDVSLGDRDVLLATIDACPVHIEYEFLALLPCATFSMMHSRGNSGQNPGLETGFGGSARLRGTYTWFFAEAMGTAVAVQSSYEPPSRPVRVLYALSLGARFR